MDNEMLALYKEANRKWNEKEHLMRNVLRYKDAPRASIGESDRRSLFAVGLTDDLMDWKIVSLDFGSSSSYYAYICNEDTAIGAHYRLVGELTSEIRIFDDVLGESMFAAKANKIRIWRARAFGCIIQLLGRDVYVKQALW